MSQCVSVGSGKGVCCWDHEGAAHDSRGRVSAQQSVSPTNQHACGALQSDDCDSSVAADSQERPAGLGSVLEACRVRSTGRSTGGASQIVAFVPKRRMGGFGPNGRGYGTGSSADKVQGVGGVDGRPSKGAAARDDVARIGRRARCETAGLESGCARCGRGRQGLGHVPECWHRKVSQARFPHARDVHHQRVAAWSKKSCAGSARE